MFGEGERTMGTSGSALLPSRDLAFLSLLPRLVGLEDVRLSIRSRTALAVESLVTEEDDGDIRYDRRPWNPLA